MKVSDASLSNLKPFIEGKVETPASLFRTVYNFQTKDIADNVLSNPKLSCHLTPGKSLPVRTNNGQINSINNTKAYRQHPWATVHIHHLLSKKTGALQTLPLC
jgi:hypothetical protein